NAAGETRVVSKKAADFRTGRAAEYLDVRPTARTRPDDDVGLSIAVHIARGHVLSAGETRREREETIDGRQRDPVKHLYVRPAARPGPSDDVRDAVAGDVAGRDAHTAAEAGGVGQEPRVFAGAQRVVGDDLRLPARIGPRDKGAFIGNAPH